MTLAALDSTTTITINQFLSGPGVGDFMVAITTPQNWYLPLSLLAAALIYIDRRRGTIAVVMAILLVALGDGLAHQILKPFFARIRPCHDLADNLTLLVGCTNSLSFPSNHAVNSVTLAAVIGYFFRRAFVPLLLLAILVCLSRVAVGVHYMADVTAGGFLGLAIGYGGAALANRFVPTGRRKTVFLDRDGCVNVEDHYIRSIDQFRLYPDSLKSLKRLNDAGFLIVIITNQSGVARGYFSEELVKQVHELLLKWTDKAGVRIDDIQYCPHHPEGEVEQYAMVCDCRKPKPGLLLRAAKKFPVDFSSSYVVGDKISDIQLGPATGAKSILVRTGFGEAQEKKIIAGEADEPDFVANGIGDAVDWILQDAGVL